MRFHLVGLPHTQTTAEWSNCAFTANVRGFAKMMKSLGHTVILYASEDNDVEVDELVTCITREEQVRYTSVTGPSTVLNGVYDGSRPEWRLMNIRAAAGIMKRAEPGDIVCTIGGYENTDLAMALPNMPFVEFAVGSSSILLTPNVFRVYASYAWMHTLYGRYYGSHGTRGRAGDRVIPHYIDPADFEYREDKDDYLLFVGRLNEDKGVGIAIDVARATGRKLVVAGQGMNMPDDVDHRGLVGPAERRELMAGAAALLVPSLYLEPFGMVAIEGLMSGTPIITSDWGGLSEINIHGETGFKCHTPEDYVKAASSIDLIAPDACRARGLRYSTDNVRYEYERYFRDLSVQLQLPEGVTA